MLQSNQAVKAAFVFEAHITLRITKVTSLSNWPFLTSICMYIFAETVKQSGLAGAALLMLQADYFSTVITLLSPLCRSGL